MLGAIAKAQVPTANLEAFYEFTNGNLTDAVNGNNFTQAGASLTNVIDRFSNANNALNLGGDYLTAPNFSFSDLTLSFWVKTGTNDSNSRTLLNKSFKTGAGFTGQEYGMYVYLKDGKIGITGRHAQARAPGGIIEPKFFDFSSTKNISDNNWHHIVISLDREYPRVIHSANPIYQLRQDVKIYVDGVVESFNKAHANSFGINNPVNQNTNFIVANNGNGTLAAANQYQDIIDDIHIYTSVLNSTEAAALGGNNGFCYAPLSSSFSLINTTATSTEVILPAGGKTYDIAFVEDGQPFSSATINSNINTAKHALGLQPNTMYNIYIREHCTAANVVSNWSGANQITTLSQIVYVNPSATGANDGSSWANGYTTLQAALDAFTGGEIWVKAGVYKPHASDQTVKFTISKANTVLFGGFIGTETSLAQRNFRANPTILSGDLLGNDDANITFANATRSDNSNNIVTLGTAADDVIIDGFTIEGADTTTDAAAINKHVEAERLTLRNLTVRNNVARNSSAGIKAPFNRTNDRLDIINSKFENNLSTYYTTLYVYFGKTFSQNGYLNIHNTLFANNKIADEATRKGVTGMVALYVNNSGRLHAKFYNNTFVNNVDTGTETGVTKGIIAALRPNGNAGQAFFNVYNSIFWNNLNASGGNLPLYGKAKAFSGNAVNTADTMINIDPKFTDEANGDYTLKNTSLAMNTGNNTYLSNTIVTDLAGNARLVEGTVDKGCFENTSGVSPYSTLTNLFVDVNATGVNDGTSWTNAFKDINDAIDIAKLNTNLTQIWIAKGTYKPDASNRNKSFDIDVPNLTLYGGFAGNEATLSARDVTKIHTNNKVVLSGDLLGNDDANITFSNSTRSDNSIHIVNVSEDNTTFDGLTISNGSFNEAATNNDDKKGVAIFKAEAVKTLTVTNCIFINNIADWSAVINLDYNDTANRGNFTFNRCVFENNLARHSTVFYALPSANSKYDLTITNTLFKDNKTKDRNGTLKSYGTAGGWIRGHYSGSEVNATLVNNTYVNNETLGSAGGDYPVIGVSRTNGTATVEVANCIFWGNTRNSSVVAPAIGKATVTNLGTVTIFNSIGQGNFSIVPAGNKTNATNNDPLLNPDFTLPNYSYALNSGDNAKLNGSLTKDLFGNTRVVGGTIDMGCYENTVGVNPYANATRLYITETSSGSNDGLSWSNAFTDIQFALSIARNTPMLEEIWFAKGAYKAHASNANVSIILDIEGLEVHGGFTGTEANLVDRDDAKIHTDNATIFAGDLSGNDAASTNIYNGTTADNTRHIIRVTKKDVVINGFTISGAAAHRDPSNYNSGAILKSDDVETLTVENCIFKNNIARHSAGIYLGYNNTVTRGNFKINRCVFEDNYSVYGAAFFSSPAANSQFDIEVKNSLFKANKSTNFNNTTPGLRAHGLTGGWLTASNTGTNISAKFVNNTYVNSLSYADRTDKFVGDNAVLGLTQNNGTLTAEVSNCIFWNNTRSFLSGNVNSVGKGTHANLGTVTVFNSTDVNSFANVVAGNQTNTLNTDPLFMSSSDFNLKTVSPSRDSGDNTKILAGNTKDLFGNARILNTTVDRGAYEYDVTSQYTTWTGASNTNWSEANNWTNGVPSSSFDAVVANAANQPIVDITSASVKDLEVHTGSSVVVDNGQALTIEGNLVQNGTFTINSNATTNGSLILKGTHSGSGLVSYNRYVSGDWHLLGAPVDGQNIVAFKNDLVTSTNGIKYSVATYNNSLASSRYVYYTTPAGANDINSAGTFTKAKGYSVKRASAGTFAFTGSLNTTNVSMVITDGSATGNKLNLVSNPYTSSLHFNVNANATNNFLTQNASELDPTAVAMYVWNAGTNSYDVINQATPAKYLAPGQGFFVTAKNGGGTVQFTEAMQSHQTGNVFSRGGTTIIPSIKIEMTNADRTSTTEVKFLNNTSIDLDPGYDARVFSAQSKAFNLFTKLVSNNNDNNFTLQCLPNSKHEEMVIPLGVSLSEDKELIFKSNATGLPAGMNVFIEDKLTNRFTNVSKESYKVLVSKNTVDRFYLHMSTKEVIDTMEEVNNELAMFVSNNSLRVLTKEQGQEATVRIFDLLGKEVFRKTFRSTGINDLNLPEVSTGVYVVKLETEREGGLSRKVIIE
ncbi:T9SS type A sorting domain-containing protein [uncultured Tenacibaculum sp.]|uniref:T9SS type A sorting domain-containing protein n=1 Tax=uncultured Tenacibaculum sp. TaxID=174713 RepID=UPI00260C6B88|nr:T9SS type A sorting domain-containing protein [uncultured Tenacibaculum sp.]